MIIRKQTEFVQRTYALFQFANIDAGDHTKTILRAFLEASGSAAEAYVLRWLLFGLARAQGELKPHPNLANNTGTNQYLYDLPDGRTGFVVQAGLDTLMLQYQRQNGNYTLTHDAAYMTQLIDNHGKMQNAPTTLIEYDSDMWHNDRRFSDSLRDHYARQDGFNVLRVPETNKHNEYTKYVPLFPYIDLDKAFNPHSLMSIEDVI